MIDLSFLSIPAIILVNAYCVLWIFLSVVYLGRKAETKDPPLGDHLVSVILPARNEERVIKNIIADIKNQTYKNIEIVVVAHNCTDRTFETASETQSSDVSVKVLRLSTAEVGKGLGLQHAMRFVTGDLIAYFDSDSKVPRTFVASMVEWVERGYDGVQSKIVASNPKRNFLTLLQHIEFLIYPRIFCGGKQRLGLNSGVGGTGVMIKKSALEKVGGFRNVLIEDFDLMIRFNLFGLRIGYAENVAVYDEKVPTFGGLVRQRSRWMAGHFQLWRSYSVKEKLKLMKSPIDFMYLFSPLWAIALVIFLMVECGSLLFPQHVTYFATPWFIWVFSTVLLNLLFSLVLRREKIGLLRELVYPYLAVAFSVHWFLVLFKSFFIRGWVDTKTEHFGS